MVITMQWLSPRVRIAMAMVSVVVSAMLVAKFLGLMPDPESLALERRARTAESLSLCASALVAQGQTAGVEALFQAIVDRDEDLVSVGVRQADGEYVATAGPHATTWTLAVDDRSTSDQMQVPIFQDAETKWGQLEFCFVPLNGSEVAGFLLSPTTRLMAFVSCVSLVAFVWLLRFVLKHLDPTKAVPRRVRDALDNLAEGLLILDTKENILLANQAFASIVGVDAEKLVGRCASRLRWEQADAGGDVARPWVEALRKNTPIANARLRLEDSQGDWHCFNINCSPLLGNRGKYCGVMVTFDDVTYLEEQNEELAKAKQVAEAASRTKSEFLANMSHEIRTPMNAIMGFAEILRRGMDESEQRRLDYLDTIHSSGSHLLELINDILDLSKIEAGKMQVELVDTSAYGIMSDVVSALRGRAQQVGISLVGYVEGKVPEFVQSDPTRLRQILMNLVGNAIKFTQHGGVTVTCRWVRNNDEPVLQYEVRDTGIGMSEEQLSRIFRPFEQADSSVTRRFGGTGLGLSISQRLAAALGGTISVCSTPEVGSTFTVRVAAAPRQGSRMLDEAEAAETVRQEQRSRRAAGPVRLRRARVLVADDGTSNRELLTLLLRRSGLDVCQAENGAEALRLNAENPVELILMDMQMPVMDGYTATRRLRDQGCSMPVIALTANAMQGDQEKCLAAGCSHFLTKPVDFDRLLDMLCDILGTETSESSSDTEARSTAAAPSMPHATCQPDSRVQDQSAADGDTVAEPASASSVASPPVGETQPITPVFCSLSMNDPELRRIAEKFVCQLALRLKGMCEAYGRSDYGSLADHAHWLKGAAGTVGFSVFTDPALRLEQLAKQRSVADVPTVLRELVQLAQGIQLDTHPACSR